MKKATRFKLKILKILTCLVMLTSIWIPFDNAHLQKVDASPNYKSQVYDVELSSRTQYHELTLPSDFRQVENISTSTGNVLSYVIDGNKLKITLGNGTITRNEHQYSGSLTGYGHAGSNSRGFDTWYLIDGNAPLYNVQYRTSQGGNWSDVWYSAGIDCFAQHGDGSWSSCYWGTSYDNFGRSGYSIEYKANTQRTTTTYYQYKITLNYSVNTIPTLNLSTPNNQRLSEVEGYNKLAISGSFQDSDVGDMLTGKYSIDGTSHNSNIFTTITANGSQQSFDYEIPIDSSIPEGNRMLSVWVEDNKGGKSAEIVRSFIVDKTGPSISITNVSEGQTYIDKIVPSISISDNLNSYTKEVQLDGQSYIEGTEIQDSGSHSLQIDAMDAVGNTSNYSISFAINKTPTLDHPIGDQTTQKFDRLTFDLSQVFSDVEDDPLSFDAVTNDPSVATATVDGNILEVESIRQGSTTINVTANDGHSISTQDVFTVAVNTRPPLVSFPDAQHLFVDETKSVDLAGSLIDEDLERVIIKGSLNGINKQTEVNPTSGNDDFWTLTWTGNELLDGVYENISIQAEDDYLGTHTLVYPKGVIKVPGTVEDYQPILDAYSEDLSKDTQDFTIEEHKDLYDAYFSVQEALEELTDENIQKAIDALNELASDSSLKSELLEELKEKILAAIISDASTITEEKLITAGFTDVVPEYISDYIKNLTDYKSDKGNDLTEEEIQQVIHVTNDVKKAEVQKTPSSFDKALESIAELEYEPANGLKESLYELVIDLAVDYVNDHKTTIEILDLERIGILDVDPSLLDDYRKNLDQHVAVGDQDEIQKVIDVTNQLKETLKDAENENVTKLELLASELISSSFKSDVDKAIQVLKEILKIEQDWEIETTTAAEGIASMVTDTVLKESLENIVTAVKKVQEALNELMLEKIDDSITAITILVDGKLKDRLLEKVGEIHFDYVQNNLETIEVEDLVRAGFQDVDEEHMEDYRDHLIELADELGRPLTREEVQQVIDVINAIEKAKESRDLGDVQKAIDLINQLPDGPLKDRLLDEMNKLKEELTPKAPVTPGTSTPPSYPSYDFKKEDSKPGDTIMIDGSKIENGSEFSINDKTIEELLKNKNQELVLKQGNEVEIDIPYGSIDFEALQKELGKYGLIIQLIKINEQNYRLKVTAVTPEGEKELVNFAKHLTVAVNEKTVVASSLKQSVVLRKEGDQLTAVPHTYNRGNFTIKTTRTGYFVVVENAKNFTDIQGTFSELQIMELANRHIVNGTSETTFSPNSSITRAELAVMIARAMDLQPTKETTFTDIKGKWYEKEVQALFEAGIITGITNTTFKPNDHVSREQSATMMSRALKYATGGINENATLAYNDFPLIGNFAKADVALLQKLDIMNGTGNDLFQPKTNLTRGQMAKLLHATLKYIEFI